MLVEFEVGNYLSFKETVRLSMLAATPFKEFEAENTFVAQRLRLLKTAAVYGANASGKSNLLSAMTFMRWFVLNSAKGTQSVEPISVVPFKLDVATENAPSHVQVVFLLDNLRYRYGFEVDRKSVKKEWLYYAEANKEYPLFLREDDGIEVMQDFEEGKGKEPFTRDNALFLSTVDQLNGPTAKKLLESFSRLRIVQGLNDELYERITVNMLRDEKTRPLVLKLIRSADLGIEDFTVDEEEMDQNILKFFSEEFKKELIAKGGPPKQFRIATLHAKYADGSRTGIASLDFRKEESEGTKKFFRMVGPILDCLQSGCVVVVDELDAKLHPLLTRAIIRLFHTPDTNPKNAQLVFGTHDTTLLYYGQFRRDQIWFTEKNEQGATDLYSLAEIKLPRGTKVRKDASFEKDYIRGRYGAIPYLGDFTQLFREEGEMGKPVKVSDQKKPWYQRNLKRKIRVRPTRERILIVCEGERTEPHYFKAIGQTLPPHIVDLAVEGPGMNTISLVREAIRLRAKEKDSQRPYDQTWAVFDKDDFSQDDFDNAITMCHQHGMRAAYSNQAFELWFVLHFEDRQSGMHRDQYKHCLSRHLGATYCKNDMEMYSKVTCRGSESEAIRRAKRLRDLAPHPPSTANPCTTVYELVEALNSFKKVPEDEGEA